MSEKNNYNKRKEARLAERKKTRIAHVSKNRNKKIFSAVGIIAVLALLLLGGRFASQVGEPEGPDFSQAVEIQNRNHIAVGADHLPYNSNPPTSGWHYASTAKPGAYDSPVPDELVIHNLEHGDIWITYRPGISEEVVEQLENFAGQYVIVSPRPENDTDIALVAWGRIDTWNLEGEALDEERIRNFIIRYDNKGPENLRGGIRHGGI